MICACVVPTDGAEVRGEELLAFARTRMADYKVPDAVRAVDALPLTETGKVQRRELARRLALDQSL
jgi:non-ribosomal peptide synthetase component E (peptide arylation enzyme)